MTEGSEPLSRAPARAVAAAGVIAAVWVTLLWGGVSRHPVWADEAAYLLQAEIFASGRWAVPGPLLPEFFEQYHVLVTPVLAAKYFPGHSLVLAVGSLVGVPGLVPIVLAGVSAMVLLALAWRAGGPWVATATLGLWLLAPISIRFLPSYLSETTTGALWLIALWALGHWRTSSRLRWLLLVAAAVGWCAITRPLTGVALALPAAAVVLRRVVVRKSWTQLVWALAAGVMVLALVPLWSRGTTGTWRETPLTRYTIDYLPWDRMGMGLDTTPARRSGPPDMPRFAEPFRRIHRFQSWPNFPTIVGARLAELGGATGDSPCWLRYRWPWSGPGGGHGWRGSACFRLPRCFWRISSTRTRSIGTSTTSRRWGRCPCA